MGVNSLPKTVTRQRRDCDLNPRPFAPKSSTLIHSADELPKQCRPTEFARKIAKIPLIAQQNFARLANTLLKDEESARDNDVLACNFAKYSPI